MMGTVAFHMTGGRREATDYEFVIRGQRRKPGRDDGRGFSSEFFAARDEFFAVMKFVSGDFLQARGCAGGDAYFYAVVNALDANLISGHFLQTNPATAVPEPGSAMLVMVGLVVMGASRRRRRRLLGRT